MRRAGGALLASWFAGGCGSRSASEAAPPPPVEVEPAAGFEDGHVVEPTPAASAQRHPIPRSEPIVRVRVLRSRGQRRRITIGDEDQWIRVRLVDDPGVAVVVQGPVTVGLGTSAWTLLDGKGFRPAFDGIGEIELASIDEPARSTITVDGRVHPGVVRLVARTDGGAGAVDVVNDVGLESYLPSVIAGELFDGWHQQTYMAQAVAARSFACAEHAYFRTRRHYDMTNTTRSQVYDGSTTRRDAIDAVAMTRGLVLAWEGLLVPGYYSSCCGGVSARAADAIGANPVNDVPPLDGRGIEEACAGSPVHTWTVVEPAAQLSERIADFGRRRGPRELAAVGRLRAVEVIEANPHGRPLRYRLTGDEARTVELSATWFRRAINHKGRKRLKSEFIHVRFEGASAIITGHGFGHGVGLCQYGAEGWAREGKTFREIVEWYYPGAEIVGGYA